MANTTALAAARDHQLARAGWDVQASGLFGAPELTVVIGERARRRSAGSGNREQHWSVVTGAMAIMSCRPDLGLSGDIAARTRARRSQ